MGFHACLSENNASLAISLKEVVALVVEYWDGGEMVAAPTEASLLRLIGTPSTHLQARVRSFG